jgi:hypothetical protein
MVKAAITYSLIWTKSKRSGTDYLSRTSHTMHFSAPMSATSTSIWTLPKLSLLKKSFSLSLKRRKSNRFSNSRPSRHSSSSNRRRRTKLYSNRPRQLLNLRHTTRTMSISNFCPTQPYATIRTARAGQKQPMVCALSVEVFSMVVGVPTPNVPSTDRSRLRPNNAALSAPTLQHR